MKEIKKQLAVTHLPLVSEIRHTGKSDLSISSPFQHEYPFSVQDLQIQKEVEKSSEKSSGKEIEKDGL